MFSVLIVDMICELSVAMLSVLIEDMICELSVATFCG